MSTRTVTYDLTLITGSAAASKVTTFDLLTPYAARSSDTVVALSTSSTSDSNGEGTVTLAVPASGAYLYQCRLPDGQTFRFSLAAGDATTLHALMAATVGSTVTSADAISVAVDAAITTHAAVTTDVHGITDTEALVTTSDYTADDVLAKLITVDGTGTGLDADLLDGNHASAFEAAGTTATHISDTSAVHDVTSLGTSTGSSTNMLRVAAAGGLEYRTTAQVLADIGAAPTASPTFTGTVTLPTTVASTIKPASDSTTALVLANAAGTSVLAIDTTNKYINLTGTNAVIQLGGARWLHTYASTTGGGAVPEGKNTFVGVEAGNLSVGSTATLTTQGSSNTAVGYRALYALTTGYQNMAFGTSTLRFLTTGYSNIAIGNGALFNITTGLYNVAVGDSALGGIQTNASYNVAIGTQAGRDYNGGGSGSLTASTYSTFIGTYAKPSANNSTNEIVIGYNAVGAGDNTVVLGNTSITLTHLQGIVDFRGTMNNSALDPTSDAPSDWVEIKIGGTTYYLPAYAAS